MNRGHLNPLRSQWTHERTVTVAVGVRRTMIEPVLVTLRPVYHNEHFCNFFANRTSHGHSLRFVYVN